MFEYNPSRGDVPSYPECMRRADEADVIVVLGAHWYGWVPEDQPAGEDGPGRKSITWLEAERAWASGKEVLGFVVETDVKAWPHKTEMDVLTDYSAPDYQSKSAEYPRRMALLAQFKKEISRYQRNSFRSEDDLAAKVTPSLSDWRERHGLVAQPVAEQGVDPKDGRARRRDRYQGYSTRAAQADAAVDCGTS